MTPLHRATSAGQRALVQAALTCTSAKDVGGPLAHHATPEDRLASSLSDTRAGLAALADLIDRDRRMGVSRPGLYADLARRLASGDSSLTPQDTYDQEVDAR